jgi:hypothetical protein
MPPLVLSLSLSALWWWRILYPITDHHRPIAGAYRDSRLHTIRQGATADTLMPAVQLMMSTAAQAALFYTNNHPGMWYAATLGHLQRQEMSPHLGTV